METKIKNKLDLLIKVVKEKLDIEIKIKNILFNLKGSKAGQAIREGNGDLFLRFNSSIYNNPKNSEDYLNTTITHEFAHLVIFEMTKLGILHSPLPHGKEWQKIMKFLGVFEPTTRHNYEITTTTKRTKKVFTYKCNCKEYDLTSIRHNKILNGSSYYCTLCNSKLKFKEVKLFL